VSNLQIRFQLLNISNVQVLISASLDEHDESRFSLHERWYHLGDLAKLHTNYRLYSISYSRLTLCLSDVGLYRTELRKTYLLSVKGAEPLCQNVFHFHEDLSAPSSFVRFFS
jgi:hypothetical protein